MSSTVCRRSAAKSWAVAVRAMVSSGAAATTQTVGVDIRLAFGDGFECVVGARRVPIMAEREIAVQAAR